MVAWNGGWWLFYSGNKWQGPNYATGYAKCASALGPCTKVQADPLLKNTGVILSPGGTSAFVDTDGRLRLAFHYWTYPYTDYPTNPGCDGTDPLTGAPLCASQGQRRMGVTGVVNPGGNILTADPVGSFDSAANAGGVVNGSGWAIDGETKGPVTVHVYADGVFKTAVTANQSRPDLNAVFPGYGQQPRVLVLRTRPDRGQSPDLSLRHQHRYGHGEPAPRVQDGQRATGATGTAGRSTAGAGERHELPPADSGAPARHPRRHRLRRRTRA